MPVTRCPWAGDDPDYLAYHDDEWGRPSKDERHLFEMIVLEGFQAGLSWRTILKKRPAFRKAFARFDPARVARFGARDVKRLLGDAGIVRHRGKIEGAIQSARSLQALHRQGGSLAALCWGAVGGKARQNRPRRLGDVPPVTPESQALSKALRALGFAYVGPTTVYAFMQATGMVNDHLVGCPRHRACAAEGRRFRPPPGLDSGPEIREERSRRASRE